MNKPEDEDWGAEVWKEYFIKYSQYGADEDDEPYENEFGYPIDHDGDLTWCPCDEDKPCEVHKSKTCKVTEK